MLDTMKSGGQPYSIKKIIVIVIPANKTPSLSPKVSNLCVQKYHIGLLALIMTVMTIAILKTIIGGHHHIIPLR